VNGGEILILDGTYNITDSIKITSRSNVSIRGNGKATILKRMFDSFYPEFGIITLTTTNYCSISDLQIDGNKTTYTSSDNWGIRVQESSNHTSILRNIINNNANGGILIFQSTNNTIIENTSNDNTEIGIKLYNSDENIVLGNISKNNGTLGFSLTYFDNSTFSGNTSNNNSGLGGIYFGRSDNSTFSGNTINGNVGNGVYVDKSDNSTITGNTCYNNNVGIYLSSSDNNNITGNTCIRGTGLSTNYSASQYTILLSDATNNYNLISSNQCMGKAVVISGGTSNTEVNNKFA